MNKIFTHLVTMVTLLCTTAAHAQSSSLYEGFENTGGLTYYQSQGWSFLGAAWNNASQIYQIGSIQLIPTTSTVSTSANSNTAQIATPLLTLSGGGTIGFSYKLDSKLGPNAKRTFTIRLMDGANVSTTIGTFTIGAEVPGKTIQISPTYPFPPQSEKKKVVIDFTGDGDGNTGMFVDNLSVAVSQSTLPIKLLSFEGVVNKGAAHLSWKTDDNEEGNYFEVQKSRDGKTFATAAVVFTTAKSGAEAYTFVDDKELNTATYYKLKMVNKDNSLSFSKVVMLNTTATNTSSLSILKNPVESTLSFTYTSSHTTQTNIVIYNTTGVKVYSTLVNTQKGTNTLSFTLSSILTPGAYFLEVANGTERSVARLVKR